MKEKLTQQQVIERFGLCPLTKEGGLFRETYRSQAALPAEAFGKPYLVGTEKAAATAIQYMITPQCFSRLHRLPTDEIYHFYLGDPVQMLLISPEGEVRQIRLGQDVLSGMEVQFVVPGGWWQGTRLLPGGEWALVGTTMAPGFDFSDYEDADAEAMKARHPQWAEEIKILTDPADFSTVTD